jgi:hypothetical protein
MRIKLLQLLVVIMILPTANMWAQAELQLSSISFTIPESTLEIKDRSFPLKSGEGEERVLVLTTDGTTKLSVKTKIKRMKSRISQHKAQGIRLTLVYHCVYKGEKRKNKTERVFWPDNDGTFKENVSFSFAKGKLKSEVANLKFNGMVKFQ